MPKILIIDDSSLVCKVIRNELSSLGFEISEIGDANEALELLQNESYDLITLDISMPDVNGFEICKFIRNHSDSNISNTPIIFVTADENLKLEKKVYKLEAQILLLNHFHQGS